MNYDIDAIAKRLADEGFTRRDAGGISIFQRHAGPISDTVGIYSNGEVAVAVNAGGLLSPIQAERQQEIADRCTMLIGLALGITRETPEQIRAKAYEEGRKAAFGQGVRHGRNEVVTYVKTRFEDQSTRGSPDIHALLEEFAEVWGSDSAARP